MVFDLKGLSKYTYPATSVIALVFIKLNHHLRIDMKLLSTLAFSLSVFLSYSQNLEVYVSAHPDDWQLFMNPNAYNSVANAKNKVLFIHTTAGDAGHGMGNNGYTLAREEGSLRAIRFMANTVTDKAFGPAAEVKDAKIKGHSIRKLSYANTAAYFLRLPDGNYYGPGYESTGDESLRNLVEGNIDGISTIDNSTSYKSLSDLQKTLIRLIKNESKGYESIIFNVAETDTIANPGDHSDHLNSSHLFQSIAREAGAAIIRFYQEYATNQKPLNVEGREFLNCAGTWGATASGLSDSGNTSTWDDVHNSWIGRQYFREEKIE